MGPIEKRRGPIVVQVGSNPACNKQLKQELAAASSKSEKLVLEIEVERRQKEIALASTAAGGTDPSKIVQKMQEELNKGLRDTTEKLQEATKLSS